MRYNNYKDSGIEWIGEIPEHWEKSRLRSLSRIIPSNIDKKSKENELSILLCNYVDVYKNDYITENINFMEATASDSQIEKLSLIKGDVIATKDSEDPFDIGIPALVKQSFKNVVCGYHLTLIRSNEEILNGDYLYWIVRSNGCAQYFTTEARGVTRYAIGSNTFKNLKLTVPPLFEQTAIAAYLDRKTAQLDELISKKERLIELLNEERTAIINQAVTKGINPNVPLKDSGIEWLGEIPAHWEIPKMKYLCEFVLDGTHGSFSRVEEGYRLLSVRNIIDNKFVFRDDDSRVTEKHFKEISSRFLIKENDIQLAIVGATLGKVAIIGKIEEDFVTQRSLATIRTNSMICDPYFLYYFILGKSFQSYLWLNAGFSAQPGVYLGTLQNCAIPFPSLKEQKTIVAFIENETEKFVEIELKTKQEIDLLKEYKTALISEVVTGKVKVTAD